MATAPEGYETARLTTAADHPRLSALFDDALVALGAHRGGPALAATLPLGLNQPERLAQLDERFALFAGCYAGAVVGAAALELAGERAVLAPLYVEPGAREVGVGHCLLQAASRYAANAGVIALDVPALPGDRETKALLEQAGGRARLVIMERVLR